MVKYTNYGWLYIIPFVFLLLPLTKAIIADRRAKADQRRRIAEREAAEAKRREAMRKAKAMRDAEKAAAEAAKAAAPKRKPGRPRKNPPTEQRPETISPAEPAAAPPSPESPEPAPATPATHIIAPRGNNAFVGQTVAFTGTLPGMTRREAIAAVEKNGGRAFDSMPAGTTLLVVGDRPGSRKLDKAAEWPSCRKITAMEFSAMLDRPLTFEPDELVAFLKARFAI